MNHADKEPLGVTLLLLYLLVDVVKTDPVVKLSQNKVTYQGIETNDVQHFRNIKYGHDTSGVGRFAPPKRFSPSSDTIVDATEPGPSCPQFKPALLPFFDETEEMSEDCLNLGISRPGGLDLNRESKIPVVVWIIGGGVIKGSAYDSHFNPEKLLQLSVNKGKPIIYVTFNYRVSIFGFARLPLLKDQKSLNVGMRDQRLALEWIKDNIQDFGGDPDRITVYGLSSGGTFGSLQVMAYGGEQGIPFQQLWSMSGPPATAINLTSDATTIHTVAVAEKLGCQGSGESGESGDSYDSGPSGEIDDSALLECLRNAPMEQLLDEALAYSRTNHPPMGLFTFIPSIDDDLIPDRQSELLKAGKFAKGTPNNLTFTEMQDAILTHQSHRANFHDHVGINMIFGWTQDDGQTNPSIPAQMIRNDEHMIPEIKNFGHDLSNDQLSRLLSLYQPSDFEEDLLNYQSRKSPGDPDVTVHFWRLARILRDMLFTCSSVQFGYEMVKHTQPQKPSFDSVRLYSLNQTMYEPMWEGMGVPYMGVTHGSDSNYIFNGLFPEGEVDEEDQILSEEISSNLINFAHTGNPNDESTIQGKEWPPSFQRIGHDDTGIPFSFNIEVIGGPFGTGPVTVTNSNGRNGGEYEATFGQDAMQDEIPNADHMGSMDSPIVSERKRRIRLEKLHQRCEYINGLAETLGV